MKIAVKFYNKNCLIAVCPEEKNKTIFALCLEALKRFEIFIKK
jgi:hypothetical protein